jgi:predicted transposase/invertase (TIGR01784 family)
MTEMLKKYAKPTVDVIFKRVFGNPNNTQCLESFLSELLKVQVKCLEILSCEPVKDNPSTKSVRLDILAKLNGRTEVNIEVQVKKDSGTLKRSLYYWSKLYSNQLRVGEIYDDLRPVISIFLLNFVGFPKSDEFMHKYVLKEQASNLDYLGDEQPLGLHFIELPKFKTPKSVPEKTLEKWLLFFKTDDDNVMEELKMSDKNLFQAVSDVELAAMNPKDRMSYDARIAGELDLLSALESNRREGRQEGKEEGKEEGKLEGKLEGKHMATLNHFTKLANKKFPNMSAALKDKIFMMSDDQLEHHMLMLFDYPDQETFEKALWEVIGNK